MSEGGDVAYVLVRLTPRARADEIGGWREGALVARVTAPPTDSKANEALRRLLAGALGVPSSGIAIVSGRASRTKRVRIEGMGEGELRRRLGGP
ncbi:MAG TPA: DUF167 domain-containing protein [Dehalococcoidia bacterium]|nr:DUF167 domain-containing protein [Dehalococcoidia bacterium]